MDLKKILGNKIAERVKDGDCIGLGTGTTAEQAIRAIGKRVKEESLNLTAVSTSVISTSIALEYGIKVLPLDGQINLSWGFDGADEVAKNGSLLKGRGGAMLKEKIVATALPELIIIVAEQKLVSNITDHYPIPVEIIPSARSIVENQLMTLGVNFMEIRTGTNFYGPLFTENGNNILDIKFPKLSEDLLNKVKLITGVVEHGYFPNSPKYKILVAKENGETYWFK
jgi:ribose 5-phosphate isomerase A